MKLIRCMCCQNICCAAASCRAGEANCNYKQVVAVTLPSAPAMQASDAATACISTYTTAVCGVIAMLSTTGIALMSAMSNADTIVPAGSMPCACVTGSLVQKHLWEWGKDVVVHQITILVAW